MGTMFKNTKTFSGAGLTADELYVTLEGALKEPCVLKIADVFVQKSTLQVINCWIDGYQRKIAKATLDCRQAIYTIELKKCDEPDKKGYSALQDCYDKAYFLEDCGGYDAFKKYGGKYLDGRLQDVFVLTKAKTGQRILDIGCGRGELSYAMAAAGACVLGVDYSSDAIAIATDTYRDQKGLALEYRCQDAFTLQHEGFDTIVMADVVEHIEQPMLEKLFSKAAEMLKAEGVLVVHTAPNKNHYTIVYPQKRQNAQILGLYLPPNPRSYYEALMHINEQTPGTLEKGLRQSFAAVKVWTGGAGEIFREKSEAQQHEDNAIFAIAAKTTEALNCFLHVVAQPPVASALRVQLQLEQKQICGKAGESLLVEFSLQNCGGVSLASHGLFPTHVSYHILDSAGQMIIFDGVRTSLPCVLTPGQSVVLNCKVDIPITFTEGKYILHITLVTEQCFWFESVCEGSIAECTLLIDNG